MEGPKWKLHRDKEAESAGEHMQTWWAAAALNGVPLLPALQLFQRRSCCLRPLGVRPRAAPHTLAALKGRPAPFAFTGVFFPPRRFARPSSLESPSCAAFASHLLKRFVGPATAVTAPDSRAPHFGEHENSSGQKPAKSPPSRGPFPCAILATERGWERDGKGPACTT